MASDTVPNFDQEDNAHNISKADVEGLEFQVLQLDAKSRRLESREASQRYWLKWIALLLCLLLFLGCVSYLFMLCIRHFGSHL